MTHHKKPEISKRLARIEGHVRGIQKMVNEGKSYADIVQQISAVRAALDGVVEVMVNEDKSYADIVQQISAVRAALDGVVEVMVQDLVEHYISQTRDERGKEVAIELKETVSNIF
jgi:CsoR family transcriptional regulator, copper-sensing transcriptional repressor